MNTNARVGRAEVLAETARREACYAKEAAERGDYLAAQEHARTARIAANEVAGIKRMAEDTYLVTSAQAGQDYESPDAAVFLRECENAASRAAIAQVCASWAADAANKAEAEADRAYRVYKIIVEG